MQKATVREERTSLGIAYMIASTILFAGSSATSKWLVATTALVGACLIILPYTGLAVFRTNRPGAHLMRGISQGTSQAFLLIAFSLMPLASAVAINFSAPLFATVAAVVFLKEPVGAVRWGALFVGFIGVLLVTCRYIPDGLVLCSL